VPFASPRRDQDRSQGIVNRFGSLRTSAKKAGGTPSSGRKVAVTPRAKAARPVTGINGSRFAPASTVKRVELGLDLTDERKKEKRPNSAEKSMNFRPIQSSKVGFEAVRSKSRK
jgi:hypothetical protein